MARLVVLLVAVTLFPRPVMAGSRYPYTCPGDCDGDGVVSVNELISGVRIVLNEAPSTSCPGLRRSGIAGLIDAVGHALSGCPIATVERFGEFQRFDLLRGPGFGFCPLEGSVLAATILHEADGSYTFTSTVAEPGEPHSPVCLGGENVGTRCTFGVVQPCRTLTADEVARVRAGFDAVTVQPGPTHGCGFADPCLVGDLRWDDTRLNDSHCASRRLARSEIDRIAEVLDALGAGPERDCPAGLCGPGNRRFCADGNATGGDGCAANCTDETARSCELDEERSGLTVETGVFPIGPLVPSGSFALLAGSPSTAGRLPLVVEEEAVRFAPLRVTGAVCLCIRGRADPVDFGAGNAGSGSIQCGSAERGAAEIDLQLTFAFLQDAGACDVSGPRPDGTCAHADYGADCLPCTADDARGGDTVSLELTTGTVGDLNGSLFDCDQLAQNPAGGLTGGILVAAWTDPALGEGSLALACR